MCVFSIYVNTLHKSQIMIKKKLLTSSYYFSNRIISELELIDDVTDRTL